jgi:hypothetical protein
MEKELAMSGHRTPAIRRYLGRLAVLMSLYLVLIFLAGYLFRHNPPRGALAYGLAVLPALPIVGVVWTVMRLLVEETDEYLRLLHVRQTLFATGFCLTIMTVWEFLQNYDLVEPGTHGFGATFMWFVGLGIGAILNRFTAGSDTSS